MENSENVHLLCNVPRIRRSNQQQKTRPTVRQLFDFTYSPKNNNVVTANNNNNNNGNKKTNNDNGNNNGRQGFKKVVQKYDIFRESLIKYNEMNSNRYMKEFIKSLEQQFDELESKITNNQTNMRIRVHEAIEDDRIATSPLPLRTPKHRHSRSIVLYSNSQINNTSNSNSNNNYSNKKDVKDLSRRRWKKAIQLIMELNKNVKPSITSPINNNKTNDQLYFEETRFINAVITFNAYFDQSEWKVNSDKLLFSSNFEIPPNIETFAMSHAVLWKPPTPTQNYTFNGHDTLMKTKPIYFHTVLTGGDGDRVYAHVVHFYQAVKLRNQFVLAAQSIVILSQFGFLSAFQQCLVGFYELSGLSSNTFNQLTITSPFTILNILDQAFLPDMGRSGVELHIAPHLKVKYSIPSNTQFPLLDLNICDTLFADISTEHIISLFAAILLERNVILVSDDIGKSGQVAECLLALIFPLKWLHVYITSLPSSLSDMIDAPVTFMLAIQRQCYQNICSKALDDILILDIDSNELFGEAPRLPSKEEFSLQSSLQEILFDRYNFYSKRRDKNYQNTTKQFTHKNIGTIKHTTSLRSLGKACNVFNRQSTYEDKCQFDIRVSFLNVICSLLAGYKKHMFFLGDGQVPIFNANSYLVDPLMSGQKRNFLGKFLSTQLFAWFLQDSPTHSSVFHEAIANGSATKSTQSIQKTSTQSFFAIKSSTTSPIHKQLMNNNHHHYIEWTNIISSYKVDSSNLKNTRKRYLQGVKLFNIQNSPQDQRRSTLTPSDLGLRRRNSSKTTRYDENEEILMQFQDAVGCIFLGENMTADLQNNTIEQLKARSDLRNLFVSLMGERQSTARICLRARSLSMLRHLVTTLITYSYEANEIGNIQSCLRSCSRYYFKRVDKYIFLDSWINHRHFKSITFWNKLYAYDLQCANEECTNDNKHDNNELHTIMIQKIGLLIQDMLTFGCGQETVLEFVDEKSKQLKLSASDAQCLEKLTYNLATAYSASENIHKKQ